jgi:Flp pilus assembly pilin Flp
VKGQRRHTRRVGAGFGLLVGVVALALVTGCGSTKTVTETVTNTVTVSGSEPTGLGPPGTRIEFGHIKALVRSGGQTLMRFDPALLLSGEAANKAAAEDGAVDPGQPVPNDNYVVDESHRLYTYIVAPDAKVTVLIRTTPEKWGPTPITVADLEKIVAGTSSRELFEPLDSGVWITINIDTVRAVYQQYKP